MPDINADRTLRAEVHSNTLDWIPSPLAGVERRMLERVGDEVARATSIVRYAPGSSFSAHTHTGGEEFLVLDGVFSDDMGDFPAGMYVRNPVGSSHTPSSRDGCTILVKLWQMDPDDQEFVRTDTTNDGFYETGRPGERVLPLFKSAQENVSMRIWEAGSAFTTHTYPDGVEFFVVGGSFSDENGTYEAGTWLRLPPGASHAAASGDGAKVWMKEGHLNTDLPLPGTQSADT